MVKTFAKELEKKIRRRGFTEADLARSEEFSLHVFLSLGLSLP
jgi:hypothetical protein